MVCVIMTREDDIGVILDLAVGELTAISSRFLGIHDDLHPLIGSDQESCMTIPFDFHRARLSWVCNFSIVKSMKKSTVCSHRNFL